MSSQDNKMPAESPAAPQAKSDELGAGVPAMDAAVGAAVLMTAGSGQEAPSAETVTAARARAAEMLRGMASGDAAESGLKDLQNLTMSMGLPAARATFQYMIKAAGLRGAAKTDAMRAVAGLSPVTEVGCMKVDFFNRTTGAPSIAYLVLDKCPRLHDLGAQLAKLKVHTSDDKWPEVIRSISVLLHIGRSVYAQTAREHLDLIRQIHGSAASDPCTEYLDLQVDRNNTTLYLKKDWPGRIGIFVRLDADVRAELARAAAE